MEINIKFNEKMIVETANRVLDEYEYNGKTIREWADLIANPITNADRIRSMTDEELADWLGIYCNGNTKPGEICAKDIGSCEECWLDWLRQEVEP